MHPRPSESAASRYRPGRLEVDQPPGASERAAPRRAPARRAFESNGGSRNTRSRRPGAARHPCERIGALDAHGVRTQALLRRLRGCARAARSRSISTTSQRAARGRLEAERAAAGERIEAAPAVEVLAEPVEQRLAHAVRRRAQPLLIGDRQLAALPGAPMMRTSRGRRAAVQPPPRGCRARPSAPWPGRRCTRRSGRCWRPAPRRRRPAGCRRPGAPACRRRPTRSPARDRVARRRASARDRSRLGAVAVHAGQQDFAGAAPRHLGGPLDRIQAGVACARRGV